MSSDFSHIGLTRWPFPIVPDRDYCTFIADREQLRHDVDDLLRALSRRDTSSIHLFWSWYGAGKTHTLLYLARRADELSQGDSQSVLHPVYTEFPKSARSFVDLYRSFLHSLDVDLIVNSFLELCTSEGADRLEHEMQAVSPDLVAALRVLCMGQRQDQAVALHWLRAESLPILEFRRIGLSHKIDSSDMASGILGALMELLKLAARYAGYTFGRVVWLLDEFQRVERVGHRSLEDINSGLHSTFNLCPTGFSLCLSFSGRPERDRLPPWFSDELRDRIGRTKVFILPPMLVGEALIFVRDVLTQFRPSGFQNPSPFFPFTEQSCLAIIKDISKKEELKPRAIMHAFNAVLQEAEPMIEAGEMDSVTPEFAARVLSDYVVLKDADES